MSVVRRCPNCGTTQASAGECDACHEAQVRYFCTNHSPGLWLDGPACGQCGARLGQPGPGAAPAARVARSPASPPAPVSTPSAARPGSRSPSATPDAWRSREPSAPAEEEPLARVASPTALLHSMLRAAVLARSSTGAGELAGVRRRTGRGLVGCMLRLALVVVLLFLAVVSAAFIFGRAVLQGF